MWDEVMRSGGTSFCAIPKRTGVGIRRKPRVNSQGPWDRLQAKGLTQSRNWAGTPGLRQTRSVLRVSRGSRMDWQRRTLVMILVEKCASGHE